MATELRMNIFPFDSHLTISSIKSASEYIILKHLSRNILDTKKDGSLAGDLVESWKISKDFKEFKFTIRENQKFSNGETITVDHIVSSLSTQLKSKSAIHFDFNKIKSIDKISQNEFQIIQKDSSPRFLHKLAHPEFGILYPGKETFKISSGCYSLEKIEKNKAVLKVNKFCPELKNKYDTVIFSYSDPSEQVKKINNNELDFCISFFQDDKIAHANISKNKNYDTYKPHIGFTYWLSFNSNSKQLQVDANREFITKAIKSKDLVSSEDSASWEEAWQLFLPNGPGRLTRDEEIKIWKKKLSVSVQQKKLSSIQVLLPKDFYLNKELLLRLASVAEVVEPIYYENQSDFVNKLKVTPDLYLINNDFSSLDLEDSIFVTFNENRPLINANKKIKTILKQLSTNSDENASYKSYKDIAETLLVDNFIVPLVHKRIIFYKKKNLSLAEWSVLFPEISAWKIIN